MRPKRRPTGFSLVELLVSSAIVIVLATLLCPMILAAQTNARELKCRERLKQLGLALHNYHDTVQQFPPGWITRKAGSLEGPGVGWQTLLLPYLDQAPLYSKINFNRGFDPAADAKELVVFRTTLDHLRCPLDIVGRSNSFRDDWPTSNYSGNGGHRPFPRWTSLPGMKYWPGMVAAEIPRPQLPTGIFAANYGAQIAEIIDGTSNTILVGERCITSGAGIWPGVRGNSQENDAVTEASHASQLQQNARSFSSLHRHVNFLICDGAVRSLKASLGSLPNTDSKQPLGLLQRLVSKADMQPLTVD